MVYNDYQIIMTVYYLSYGSAVDEKQYMRMPSYKFIIGLLKNLLLLIVISKLRFLNMLTNDL